MRALCRRALSLVAIAALLLGVLPLWASETGRDGPWERSLIVHAPGELLGAVESGGGDFIREDAPGAPALPVWTALVELPAHGAFHVSVHVPAVQSLQLDAGIPPAPVVQPVWDSGLFSPFPGAPPDRIVAAELPDAGIYHTDALYPASRFQAGPDRWMAGKRLLPLRVYPFRYNPVRRTVEHAPEIAVRITVAPAVEPKEGSARVASAAARKDPTAATATGDAVRVRTGVSGIYRLGYGELAAAGVPVAGASPAGFAMDYLGDPVAIEVVGSEDGRFDPGDAVLFYAEPYRGRYANHNVYRFRWGTAAAARMRERTPEKSPWEPAVVISQTAHIEYDRVYYSTYGLPTDADHFFDTALLASASAAVVSTTYSLELEDPLLAGDLRLTAQLHGGRAHPVGPDQSVAISLNGAPLGRYRWDGRTPHRAEAVAPATLSREGHNQVVLEAALSQLPGLDMYWVSPDWVEVTYPARADAEGDRLAIEAFPVIGDTDSIEATGFTTGAVRVYDTRDPLHPVRLRTVAATGDGAGYRIRFWDDAMFQSPPPAYFLTTVEAALEPLAIEPDAASGWRSPANNADYIAIVHRSLWEAIDPLLAHRAAEGLRVAKIDVQDIFDEFAGGRGEPQAIRDFLTYAYHQWNGDGPRPEYVLLVGDGHYDFKGAVRPDLPNLIPPYLLDIDPFIGETASDSRYACADGPEDILPDMHLGRLPARTPGDVAAAVEKILSYEKGAPDGEWNRRVVYVADSSKDPAGNFHRLSDEIRYGSLPSSFASRGVYYLDGPDLDTGPEVREAIRGAFESRVLLLQWFGHASRFRWGSVRMFDVSDPPALSENHAWPATVSLSCWSGYFIGLASSPADAYREQSLAEALILAPRRGSVVDLSPTGLHVGDPLLELDRALTEELLVRRRARFGPAVDAAKLRVFQVTPRYRDLIDTMALFGDPATRLQLPPAIYYLPVAPVGAGLP
jgi:hypothetical protein